MTTATAVRERPILMSGPMVRAVLDGSKTQTRRVVKPQPRVLTSGAVMLQRWRKADAGGDELFAVACFHPANDGHGLAAMHCPHGQAGDQLWVRESHRYLHDKDWCDGENGEADSLIDQEHVRYEADLRIGTRRDNERGGLVERVTYLHESTPVENNDGLCDYRRRSPIHMPRWASRLTLEITGVRVERLNEIGEVDARAEGVLPIPNNAGSYRWDAGTNEQPYRREYATLWDSLNAKRGYPWESNPWVWAIEFRRVGVAAAQDAGGAV